MSNMTYRAPRIMCVWRTKTEWLLYIINTHNQLTVQPGKALLSVSGRLPETYISRKTL